MTKAPKLSSEEHVTQLIQKLEPAITGIVQRIREIVLGTDKEIAEQVKWNSPAFYYSGEMKPFDPKEYKRDIVVLNLHKGHILLVFPTGAIIPDDTGLLEGNYTDGRRIVTIENMKDLKAKEKQLQKVIKDWLALVDK